MAHFAEYTYSITSLKVKDEVNATTGEALPSAVVQTYWKVEAADSAGSVGFFSGATPFTAVSVSLDDFQEFSTLTEEAVIGWVRSHVEADDFYWNHIDECIQKVIDDNNQVVREVARPWAPADDEVTPPLPADAPQDPGPAEDDAP